MTIVLNVWCEQQSSLLLLGMFKGPVNRLLNFMPLRSHVFGSFLPYIRSALTVCFDVPRPKFDAKSEFNVFRTVSCRVLL